MRSLLLLLLLVPLNLLGGPPPDRGASATQARSTFELARREFHSRLPALLAPVRETFARARAGAPEFARWSNSSWTGLTLAGSAAVDWCARPAPESRVARAVREEFERDVLSPAALEAALAQTLDDFRVALAAARVEAFLTVAADCGDLLDCPGTPAPPTGRADFPTQLAPGAEVAAGGAVLYRALDLGLDRLTTGILAPVLVRLAARLGLRAGGVGAGLASFGVALLVSLILEYLYDGLAEGRIVASVCASLDPLEAGLLDGESGLASRLQEFADRQWDEDLRRIEARLR